MRVQPPALSENRRIGSSSWPLSRLAVSISLAASFWLTGAVAQQVERPRRAAEPARKENVIAAKDGPDGALTLKAAEERFLKNNLELRAMRLEIPMAQADIEAAGQSPQASLWVWAGPDGIHVWRLQPRELLPARWADVLLARTRKQIREAQYQDAVRTRLDSLYTAFIDVQAAQLAVRFNQSGLRGMEGFQQVAETLRTRGQLAEVDFALAKARTEMATHTLVDAKMAVTQASLALANLLDLPDAGLDQLTVAINDLASKGDVSKPPPQAELIRLARGHRGDLTAHRLGLRYALLEWLKTLIEPLSQITVPPMVSSIDGAIVRREILGPPGNINAVFALPKTTENRARRKRAAINVEQARIELAKVERQVLLDVRRAQLEYDRARATADRFRDDVIPSSTQIRDSMFQAFKCGDVPLADYLDSQQKHNESVRQYVDAQIRAAPQRPGTQHGRRPGDHAVSGIDPFRQTTRGPGRAASGPHRMTCNCGNDFRSSAMPASVTLVLVSFSHLRPASPFKCGSPASVTWVSSSESS